VIAENQTIGDLGIFKSRIECRPAQSREDYSEAFRLIHRQYCLAGLSRPSPTMLRIAPHQLWPECETLVAERESSRIVGTLSLIGDGPRKLPLESYFPGPIEKLRKQGHRLLEVDCLASIEQTTSFASQVFAALTRSTRQYANLKGYDRTIAAVHPRHCKFYERAMGFRRISDVVTCAMVEGNLAICVVGNPTAPLECKQPWREILYGDNGADLPRRKNPMSSFDRFYFSKLLEQSQQEFDASTRRAA
jgi:hypothetical protein